MATFQWKDYEDAIRECVFRAVTEVMGEYPDESFYGVAFHEFYAEEFDTIHLPCLAANTIEELEGADDSKWSSPDWYWIEIPYVTKAIERMQDALVAEATRKDVSHWYKVHKRYVQAFINVAKSLTPKLKTGQPVTKDFGVFVFEWDDSATETLRKCMTDATFRKLLPYLQEMIDQEKAIGESSLDEKLAIYRKDLFQYEQQILEIGEPAIPMLLDALKDRENGWNAASILGKVGIPDKRVMAALRRRARKGDGLRCHDTIALALLGDIDFLLKLADDDKTRDVAVDGLSALYSSWANACRRKISLDYGPMEKLLAKRSCSRKVKELYSGRHISVSDMDEAFRGLKSKHKVIRENAVCVLGDNRLGRAAGQQILPKLVECFLDKSANVRRLAVINVYFWKKAARPYLKEMRRLIKDPDPDVRSTARQFSEELA